MPTAANSSGIASSRKYLVNDHRSRQAVGIAHHLGGAGGEIRADFLLAERGPHVHVGGCAAVRATGMSDELGFERLLAAVEYL